MKKDDILFWKDKKVLITGHTGFVGTWMCIVLQRYGANIFGLSLEADKDSLFEKVKIDLNIKNYYVDLREYESVKKVLEETKPEIVIHLAAFGFVKECVIEPFRTYTTNVLGTVNFLEAVNNCEHVKNVLIVSSDKVYRNDGTLTEYMFNETDALGGLDTYSASKTCEDLVAQSYFDTYLKNKSINLNIVRPGNILGGGDHIQSRLVPSLLNGFDTGKPIEIRNKSAIRPWQHILDAIDAYLTIIVNSFEESGKIGIYNVGPEIDGQMSVGQIFEYLQNKFSDKEAIFEEETECSVKEAGYLGISIEKLSDTFLWKPHKNIRDILDDVYDFYIKSKEMPLYDICIEQIEKYIECL